MKFRVTLKDPDGTWESIRDAARWSLDSVGGISEKERVVLFDARREEFAEFTKRWIDAGEYVTIEFDTEAGTATVVER